VSLCSGHMARPSMDRRLHIPHHATLHPVAAWCRATAERAWARGGHRQSVQPLLGHHPLRVRRALEDIRRGLLNGCATEPATCSTHGGEASHALASCDSVGYCGAAREGRAPSPPPHRAQGLRFQKDCLEVFRPCLACMRTCLAAVHPRRWLIGLPVRSIMGDSCADSSTHSRACLTSAAEQGTELGEAFEHTRQV